MIMGVSHLIWNGYLQSLIERNDILYKVGNNPDCFSERGFSVDKRVSNNSIVKERQDEK